MSTVSLATWIESAFGDDDQRRMFISVNVNFDCLNSSSAMATNPPATAELTLLD